MCVSVSPLFLSVFQTRSKSFDTWNLISDREIPDPEGDYRREKDLSRWSGINAFDAKRFFKNGERRGILRGGRSRFFVVDYIIQLLVPFATLVRFNELFGGFNVFRHQVLEICLEIVKKRKAKSLVFRLSANSISEIFIFFNFFPVLFLK